MAAETPTINEEIQDTTEDNRDYQLYHLAVDTLARAYDKLGTLEDELHEPPSEQEILGRLNTATPPRDSNFGRTHYPGNVINQREANMLTLRVIRHLPPQAAVAILGTPTVITLEDAMKEYPPRTPSKQETLSTFLFKQGNDAYADSPQDQRVSQFLRYFTEGEDYGINYLTDKLYILLTRANSTEKYETNHIKPRNIHHFLGRMVLKLPLVIIQHWTRSREPFPIDQPFSEDLYYVAKSLLDELNRMNDRQIHHVLSGKYRFEDIYTYRKRKPPKPEQESRRNLERLFQTRS